ncbi:hypothetical protein [Paenibacillus sp. 1001270B_150601_E10]|uniref:hypothetical protein n=1 Tax=Paenibacillus sp. 1001270B_150601_E10 TaxID=2787079 RepID=UPI002B4C0CBA|nr:hypothetical protein [Paenibacillus sp. 1001270B_150601_E10]
MNVYNYYLRLFQSFILPPQSCPVIFPSSPNLADIGETGATGATGETGATGTAGVTGATGPAGIGSTKSILFGGSNAGFQRIAGSPGADSQVIPYVTTASGNVVGFSCSISINNLAIGNYVFQVCGDVPLNLSAPSSSQILSTISLVTTASITGTIAFSIRPTDIGPQPVKVFNPNPIVAPATVTWTSSISGNAFARNTALSLYAIPNITQVAVYSVSISSNI